MKNLKTAILLIFFLWIGQLAAQPNDSNIHDIINTQKQLYEKLTTVLNTSVDSCNKTLIMYNKTFEFDVSLLTADSINKATEPGEIDFPASFDENDVLLILDRLKMRNNSINQITKIITDETSYLKGSVKTYKAKEKLYTEAAELAQKRFEQTETWGKKRYWNGLKHGAVTGCVLGLVVGWLVL